MFDTFIGLEIHIQLKTASKVFCSCGTAFGDDPNTHVCPVCLGYPGVLPSLNHEAVRFSYMVGKALSCSLADRMLFDRKNYFYPDMTKNYQISQFHEPVGVNGSFSYEADGEVKTARIHDIHLEEDAGKMIHSSASSLLDYNRAGSSLLEIVTEPDLRTPAEAEYFLREFRRMVRYLGVCDGNMEEGSLRCDANVSVNFSGKGLGTKVEIKNMNSSRFVRKALSYEIKRQRKMMKLKRPIIQETRLWDEKHNKTLGMRSKEEAHDYRYFPEPDLPPFVPGKAFMESVDAEMCELPLDRKERFISQYGLRRDLADFITGERERADWFEAAAAEHADIQACATWMKGELTKILTNNSLSFSVSPLTPKRFSILLKAIDAGSISAQQAKKVAETVITENAEPEDIISRSGFDQSASRNREALAEIVAEIAAENPDTLKQIRDGNQKAVGFLMGQVMKRTSGAADPGAARNMIMEQVKTQN
ncbi:MAG: Asp-tRNA(Asn)/Glu-tRNA(Gln) amidotransferase subunit GatB [Spirochaetia bacterium]|nr:Asp-tRNA(Asn)/Glu-tRNA(Gln) amidotransferase subunit GatB [Spirochaetia bacterium]